MEKITEVSYHDSRPVITFRSGVLRVVSGPDQALACALDNQRVSVGTAENNDLVLTDPRVSRRHLEIQVHDQGYLLLDLSSTNGTYFRGARVQEVLLQLGAEIRLGATVLRLDRGEERVEAVLGQEGFGSLIGLSPAMQQLYGLLAAVAPTDTTVLLEGESGTGKELVAEEIHRQSPRKDKLLSVVDCGAIPANLMEAELFGYERGAFSGATAAREGIFERTRGGTIFLDEIGELPFDLQSRLLRVLDRRTIKRLGSNLARKVNVRLVAATCRDLSRMVAQGSFRPDLFYRLAVMRIIVPPLRQRLTDIPLLARHFLWQAGCPDPDSVLTAEVLQVLQSRAWPGNVRELRNLAERTVILADGVDLAENSALHWQTAIQAEENPDVLAGADPDVQAGPSPSSAEEDTAETSWLAQGFPPELIERPYKEVKEEVIHQLEKLYLRHLFRQHGSNIAIIAQQAKMATHLVRRLLYKHDILQFPPAKGR